MPPHGWHDYVSVAHNTKGVMLLDVEEPIPPQTIESPILCREFLNCGPSLLQSMQITSSHAWCANEIIPLCSSLPGQLPTMACNRHCLWQQAFDVSCHNMVMGSWHPLLALMWHRSCCRTCPLAKLTSPAGCANCWGSCQGPFAAWGSSFCRSCRRPVANGPNVSKNVDGCS